MSATDHSGEFAPCHALLGSTAEVVRCGRPEDHEMHDPLHFMAHVYSPHPPDADDPFRYDYAPDFGSSEAQR